MSYFAVGAPDITAADLNHPSRRDIIADLEDRCRAASATIADLDATNATLRSRLTQAERRIAGLEHEVRRLTVPTMPAPVNPWLPARPGITR